MQLPGWIVIWSNGRSVAVQSTAHYGRQPVRHVYLNPNSNLGDWRVIIFDAFRPNCSGGNALHSCRCRKCGCRFDRLYKRGRKHRFFRRSGSFHGSGHQPWTKRGRCCVTCQMRFPPIRLLYPSINWTGPILPAQTQLLAKPARRVCTITSLAKGETANFVATYVVTGCKRHDYLQYRLY